MNEKDIGRQLSDARRQSGMTLADIASKTRISEAYLHDLEAGRFDFLPSPYVHAYLKSFANLVGLEGEALSVELRAQVQEEHSEASPESAEAERQHEPASTTGARPGNLKEFGIFLGIVAVISLVLIVANIGRHEEAPGTNGAPPVEEIPIETMIAKTQARLESLAANPAPPSGRPAPAEIAPNPFRLRMTALDTVWIRLVTDGQDTSEYLFMPNRSRTWQADSFFVLRTGNAGATQLSRDGVDLGTVGPVGRVRRVRITRTQPGPAGN